MKFVWSYIIFSIYIMSEIFNVLTFFQIDGGGNIAKAIYLWQKFSIYSNSFK